MGLLRPHDLLPDRSRFSSRWRSSACQHAASFHVVIRQCGGTAGPLSCTIDHPPNGAWLVDDEGACDTGPGLPLSSSGRAPAGAFPCTRCRRSLSLGHSHSPSAVGANVGTRMARAGRDGGVKQTSSVYAGANHVDGHASSHKEEACLSEAYSRSGSPLRQSLAEALSLVHHHPPNL